jgi:hypothetical protein
LTSSADLQIVPIAPKFKTKQAEQAAEKVAQALLPVRFSQFSRSGNAIHRQSRTGKSACATKIFPESQNNPTPEGASQSESTPASEMMPRRYQS